MTLVVKNLSANEGDIRDCRFDSWVGKSPGGGHGNPLQYSCLESLMDRGAWWATSIGSQRVGRDLSILVCMQRSLFKENNHVAAKEESLGV